MRILAIVPARGGSKRLPGKNLRSLGGRPLIVWSIDVGKDLPDICDILVSTDDSAIAGVARKAGALVPWLRPSELATDTASSVDVALHALNWYEGAKGAVDGVLLLQPTSPFRKRETVEQGLELFRQHGRRPVVSVSPASSHPMWCFRVEGQRMRPFIEGSGVDLRSQDLPSAYVINGAFYLASAEDLRQHRSFFSESMTPLVIERAEERLDIDTTWDWMVAEAALR